ncbi:uncharacterized protein [Antedon mediterranea]|uniref:uncharacterized protein n=1 Tax=Antedon mediterranea TaxID=105859 RepID=UPI003AF8731C
MPTLEEASQTSKRQRTFVGRPQAITSGIKLCKVKPVANRSDILLDDQMFIVKDLQDALENAMHHYDRAKTENDKILYQIQVDELKAKCDEMVLLLKVVDKINRELMYARVELTKAAKIGKNVQAARKRVVWLEDRKEKLLLKYRRPPSARSENIEKSAFLDDSDEYDENYPPKIPPSADAAIPDLYSSNVSRNTFSSIDDILPSSPVRRNRSRINSLPHRNVFPESFFEMSEVREDQRLKQKRLSKQKPLDEDGGRVVLKPEKSILKFPSGSGDASIGMKGAATGDREYTEMSIYPQNSVTTATTPEVYSEISDSRPSTMHRNKRQSNSGLQQRTQSEESHKGVFLTERSEDDDEVRVSRSGEVKEMRKVSVISPQPPDYYEEENDEEESDVAQEDQPPNRSRSTVTDATEEYWLSDHHRFEYNQFVDALTKENPLSYHSLGLAVQSTFMSSADTNGPELPWLEGVTAGNMGDAQKIALDKLSEKIHKMYSKVEGAAIQSVQMTPTPVENEATLLATMEGRLSCISQKQSSESKPDSSKSVRSLVSIKDDDEDYNIKSKETSSGRHSSMKTKKAVHRATASDLPKQQLSNTGLMYNPPAIPIPEVLPLTRTNPNKIYPKISSDWNNVDPDPIPPTIRLVNQMNVAKETTLLLYKSKESKRIGFTLPVKKRPTPKSKNRKNVTLANHPILAASRVAAMMMSKQSTDALRLDKDGLKWKRVESLIYEKLLSENVQERRDAAMHLGSLKCVNEEVFSALIQRVEEDKDSKVRYKASKSLITLGCWKPVPITALLNHLQSADLQIQLDIVKTIITARNVHFINKNQPCIKELIEKLKQLCQVEAESELAYYCAVCLGSLCEQDQVAKQKLLKSLQSKDSYIIAQSLETLVRQMHTTEPDVVQTILVQLQTSKVSKHRCAAARLLNFLGSVCIPTQEAAQNVFNVLEQQLYNDPVKDVRSEIANTVTELGMRSWLMDNVESRLEDEDDSLRTSAVISVGVLGMKSDHVIRMLLDMLELDSSDYVRLMVVRTFAQLGVANLKIMRSLRDKERSGGPLSREAANALKILQGQKKSHTSRQGPRMLEMMSPPRSPVASPNRCSPIDRKNTNNPHLKIKTN